MYRAVMFEDRSESRVKCNICQWRCVLGPGKSGVCRMYQNSDGVLYNLNYAQVSSVAIDPVEKKPLFHFFPATKVFSLGGWGCNFHCRHCQNWEISCPENGKPWLNSRLMRSEESIELAKRHQCQGIAWTYNEPSSWFEYTLDSAKIAKENNLYTIYVTNGYLTLEALDAIGPYLDAWRVDIKGFSEVFYRELAGITRWQGILEVTKRAKDKWNMHVEVVTNIIPTMNDDDRQLEAIAGWIRDELGEFTPWHVTRFYPQHNMMELPPTPLSTLERACAIGQKIGLKFIYAGNVPGHDSENTFCYSCGNLVVERFGYQTKVVGLDGSRCKFCGVELNFRTLGGGG
ncbi:AmmeMemoRadiSam system radical SAM enzyme [Chloroflexota bacterium]